MLSTGISIPWLNAQRFQQYVASACALPWTFSSETITTLLLPALRNVLDCSNHLVIGPPQSKKTALVGSIFVPVIIDFARELDRHDFLTQRCLLDIFMVTFFKQDVRSVELSAISAMRNIADFAAARGSVENRLLAIQIIQTAVSRLSKEMVTRAVP